MNGVIGMTELALMEPLPPKAREYLGFVKQSANSLLGIINDILDLAKIEAGRIELKEEDFDLRADFSSLLSTLSALASRKGLTLHHSVAQEVPRLVRGDRGRLGQVFANLIGNAIKFTEVGEVFVSVRVADEVRRRESRDSTSPAEPGTDPEEKPAGGIRLLCEVRDTGVGIPPDRLGTVFEAFTQVGGTSHAPGGGTGLGLTISRQLVGLMGGRIWVESPALAPSGGSRDFPPPGGHEPGPGSAFRFTAELGIAEARAEVTAARAAPRAARPRTEPLRVLLAEDNVVNQLLGRELLERGGHAVVVAADGRKALEALAREPFDVVLMDVQMPEVDGLEAARLIREGAVPGVSTDIPIIALTAHALQGDRERFLAAGMDDYISKPIDVEVVYEVLAKVNDRRRQTLPE
jgi:CheY-like chemotaxis protein